MEKQDIEKLIKATNILTVWASIPLIIALGFIYVKIGKIIPGSPERELYQWLTLLQSVLAGIIPVFLLFIGSYLILQKIQDIKQEAERKKLVENIGKQFDAKIQPLIEKLSIPKCYDNFNRVPWDDYIKESSKIDILVHYFDTWINQRTDIITDFFRQGGTLNLIIPNPEDENLIRIIKSRFNDSSYERILDKVRRTSGKFQELRNSANNPTSKLNIFITDQITWYCAVRFDERYLILSPYEHTHDVSVQSPAVVIPLDNNHPKINDWFNKEMRHFAQKS